MGFQAAGLTDDSDTQQTRKYLEARIESLKQRIVELEGENEILRSKRRSDYGTIARFLHSRPSSY